MRWREELFNEYVMNMTLYSTKYMQKYLIRRSLENNKLFN
jgi:hypothetical protein